MRLVDFAFAGVDPEVMGLMIQLARQFAGQPAARYGLTTMCVGLGMGGTVLWENLSA
jgi:hypothetical protein